MPRWFQSDMDLCQSVHLPPPMAWGGIVGEALLWEWQAVVPVSFRYCCLNLLWDFSILLYVKNTLQILSNDNEYLYNTLTVLTVCKYLLIHLQAYFCLLAQLFFLKVQTKNRRLASFVDPPEHLEFGPLFPSCCSSSPHHAPWAVLQYSPDASAPSPSVLMP